MVSDALRSPRWATSLPMLIAIAAIVGGGYAAWVVGARVLHPTDVSWLANDPAINYAGWAFLRAEPDWQFPPTFVRRLGHPVGISASLLDVTPVMALPLRAMRRWLPEPFQYLGLLAVLNGALQMLFGMLLARRWFPDRPLAIVLAGTMFLLAPVFVFRLHGHITLASQWMVLAAFLLYLGADAHGGERRSIAGAMLLLWGAGGMFPYLLAMVGAILAAALASALLEGRVRSSTAVLLVATGLTVGAGSAAFHGFLTGGGADAFVGQGFGTYSLNLLALVNPQGTNALLLPSLPQFDGQGEGFAYLGFGTLLLLLWALPTARAWSARVSWRRWLPLTIACLLLATFALSHRITLGSTVLIEVPLPRWAALVGGTFRASGRFVWPLVYLLLATALRSLSQLRPARVGTVLLGLAVVLQLEDTSGLRRAVAALLLPAAPPRLASPDWHGLAAAHDHLVVLPAWQCSMGHDTPGGVPGYALFLPVAIENHLTLNSFYAARYGADLLAVHCDAVPRAFVARGMASRTAYVLDDAYARSLAQQSAGEWGCARVDGMILCRHGSDGARVPGDLFVDAKAGDLMPIVPGGRVLSPGWRVHDGGVVLGRRWAGLAFRHAGAVEAPLAAVIGVVPAGASPARSIRVRVVVDGTTRPVTEHAIATNASALVVPLGAVAPSAVVGVGLRLVGATGARSGLRVRDVRIVDDGGPASLAIR